MIVNVNCLSHALNQKIVALCIPEEKYHCMERVRKNPINELKATLSFTRAIYGCPFLNQWGHLYRKDWCDFLSAFPALTILQVTGMGFLFLCFLCRITQLRSFGGNNKQDILSLPTTRSSSCPPLTQAAVSCWRILLFFSLCFCFPSWKPSSDTCTQLRMSVVGNWVRKQHGLFSDQIMGFLCAISHNTPGSSFTN